MSAQLTLDQFRVFLAVHDEGSFSAAARRLNRAQSAVSRTVVALENAIGVKLFDRAGYRPQVTQAGKALLADARTVIDRSGDFTRACRRSSETSNPTWVWRCISRCRCKFSRRC